MAMTPLPPGASMSLAAAWSSLSETARQQLAKFPTAVSMGGNWFTPDGEFIVAGQGSGKTPAQSFAEVGPDQVDPTNGKHYIIQNGKKFYTVPDGGPSDTSGGGLFHGRMQWNPDTGEYDSPIDFSKIASWVAAGLVTAGAANAAMAAAGPSAAATSGATGATTGATGAVAGTAGPATGAVAAPLTAAGASAVPWGDIFKIGSSLFGNLFAANMQSNAAEQGAALQAAAAKYAADKAAEAQANALKFQYDSSENAFQNNEAARQGNYGVFAARERRLGTIGQEVGLGEREIPAYVPGVDPKFGSTGTTSTSTGTGGGGALPPAPKDLSSALSAANSIAYGGAAKHTDPAYWQALWSKDPDYAWRRMLGEGAGGADVPTTGPFAGAAAPPPTMNGSQGPGMFQPYVAPPVQFQTNTQIAPAVGMFGG